MKSKAAIVRIEAHDRREDDPTRGFQHFGDFAQAVANAAIPGPHRRIVF